MSGNLSTHQRRRFGERPGVRRTFLLLAAGLSLLLVVGSGFAIAGIRYYDSKITKILVGREALTDDRCMRADGTNACLPSVTPECLQNVCNWLVIGSDSREELTDQQQLVYGDTDRVEGQRADTIIVVNQDPNLNRTVVLHIPRDLRVPLPNGETGRINTAYEEGPDGIVRAVEDITGLSINHFVSVNFAGFINVVNALGGVSICIDRPLVDRLAGLDLPEAGCYELQGRQALAFVRARHIQGDAIPDFSRISRQQQFIRSVINELLSPGAALHLPSLIEAAQDNLVIDENLNLYDVRDLTNELAQVGTEGVTFRVTPAVPTVIDEVSYLELQPKARQLFARIRDGRDLGALGKVALLTPISPADVKVQLYDAGNPEAVDEVAEYLRDAGFVVHGIDDAPPELSTSALLYSSGFGKQKEVASSYLPLVPVQFVDTPIGDSDVVVVVASDFPGINP
jgi:LCP family protein required for cell wall assembly